jgi:CHAT domain-containing protein/tetratricopeptide (TPR) repeat protein
MGSFANFSKGEWPFPLFGEAMAESSREEITRAVESLLAAQTWDEKKRLVEAQRGLLLTEAVDQVFASLLEQRRSDKDASYLLLAHRDLMAHCRQDGIELAFAGYLLPTELQILLAESKQLTRPSDMPRKVELCRAALRQVNRSTDPCLWGGIQNLLADSLLDNPFGERAENVEEAIFCCENALEVFTRSVLPEDWALTLLNLAKAYRCRVHDEHADNLERAISFYQQALEVFIRQKKPRQWALAHYNLAATYSDRICGERAENVDQAIFHYEQALTMCTHSDFPGIWADLQYCLALTYRDRIYGEQSENLELVIRHHLLALKVYTRQAFPHLWAAIQRYLADAYALRIRGARAENVEQAIYHYKQALEICTRQAFPEQWALIQHNLANAYTLRICGKRADNLEQGIQHCEQALEVCTRHTFPKLWAATQNSLSEAYFYRIRGEHAENLERAIFFLEQTLEVYTAQAFPERWARTQNNLALSYRDRIRGERANNLEQAFFHCGQALTVFTRQAFPENWARVQVCLMLVYRVRVYGEHADNLEQAISHCEQALTVYTPEAWPEYCRSTAYWLGCLFYDMHRFAQARRVLGTAHFAVEALRGEIRRDRAKRTLAEENSDLYARLVSCCLRDGDEAAALQYAIAGKGRAFVDQLASVRLDLSTLGAGDPALANDLRTDHDLRQQLNAIRDILKGEIDPSLPEASFSPDALRAQRNALQEQVARHWKEMTYKYPALTATKQAPMLTTEQACGLSDELGATLVEYYHHAESWCAFVVTSQSVHYVPLPQMNDGLLARMASWVREVESPSRKGRNWLSYLRLSGWYDVVFAPVSAYLPLHLPVILAPFSELHVLPLAAARQPQTGRFVAEDYQLAFAPSLAALYTVREQVRRTDSDGSVGMQRLLNVAYPGTPGSPHHLPNVLPEAQAIAEYFALVTPLYQEAATPDAVVAHSQGQDAVHFGCHGWFDVKQPEESGLSLAGGMLTVQDIISRLHLDQVRIATLGACESGRAVLQRGDEYTGLMQAMLTTGVQAVVASLWKVDDDATHALFVAFYTRLVAGQSPAEALLEATRFVREQPGWEHPYYWAAFQVSGLAHESRNPGQLPLSMNETVRMHASTHATTRGDKLMNVEQQIEGALILLSQMSEYPNEVLKELNEVEQGEVVKALEALDKQAATVQSYDDLSKLTVAIYHLVEDQAGLRALLLPEGSDVGEGQAQRYVPLFDNLATAGEQTYVQRYAPQIRNAVIECHTQLEAALRAAEEADRPSKQGKGHEHAE